FEDPQAIQHLFQLERLGSIYLGLVEKVFDALVVGRAELLVLGGFQSPSLLLRNFLAANRLLDPGQQVPQVLFDDSSLFRQLGEVQLDASDGGEDFQDRQGCLRKGELTEDMWHLAEHASAAQAALDGRA